jgi:putative flippase GtrA
MATVEPQTTSQRSISPTTKVSAGGTAGAVSVLVIWLLGLIHQVPAEVASAVTVIVSFGVSYLVSERRPARD